jgi:hypothetical protein
MQNNEFNNVITSSQTKKEELIFRSLFRVNVIQNWLEKCLALQGTNNTPLALGIKVFGIIRQSPVSNITVKIKLSIRLLRKVLGNAPGRIDGTRTGTIAEFFEMLD